MPSDDAVQEVKRSPATGGVLDLISNRWSPRAFAETAVTDAELTTIFSAGLWAASCYNEQPWRFLLGRKEDPVWTKIFASLLAANQSWAWSAPVLFASFAKKTLTHNGEVNHFARHDVGAASCTISLQATSLGLHAHGMAGFNAAQLCEAFQVPSEFDAVACWALGRRGDPEQLPEALRTRELAPRSRKGADEVVFGSVWGTPALR